MIGPHIIGPIGSYRDLIQRWRPRAALLLDPSSGDAATIKRWSPGTFLVGRVFREDQEVEHRILSDPSGAAEWAMQLITNAADGNREVDVWQITNEIAQSSPGDIARLAAFSSEYIRHLALRGLRAAIGGFSVGRPEAPQLDNMAAWGAFLPAMREGLRHNAVLLLHAYGGPHIYDKPEDWYLHRYERVVLPFLPDDVRMMPYVYGEYGCDMGVLSHGDRRGWNTGYNGDFHAYAEDLRKASEVLARHPQCLGACLFTLGNNSVWGDFDVAGAAAEALASVAWPAAAPVRPAPPVVPVAPPPAPAVILPPPPFQPLPAPAPIPAGPVVMAARERIGIDANSPLEGFSISPRVANPGIIADIGVGWVRLNFVVGPWESVEDPAWESAFRQIVGGFRSRGLKVYGLINCEAVRPTDFGDSLRQAPPAFAVQQEWIDRYVDTFASIVRRFHSDVAIWESFNEPDDWHNPDGRPERRNNWVHPGWFAIMLERIHNKVKLEMGLGQTRLVSGPVQGLAVNQNAGAEYLRKTYREGKQRFGWGNFGKPFPFDGVGYHLYVEENARPWEEQSRQVPVTYANYLRGVKDVIQNEEGGRKSIYISEAGWHSNGGRDVFQSQNLPLGLELLLKDPWVDLAIWFCTQDFGPLDGNKFYGVYGPGSLDSFNRKAAYGALQTFCARAWEGLPAAPAVQPTAPFAPPAVTPVQPLPPPPAPIFEPRPVFPSIDVPPPPPGITNIQVINAFKAASLQAGLGNWGLMSKAGLSLDKLARDRQAPYTGPALDALTRLNAEERQKIRSALPDDVDFGFPVHDAFMARWPELAQAALELPASLRIALTAGATASERRLAAIWNRFGFLLMDVADILGLNLPTAVAVLAALADGRGMDAKGRLVIRFEVNSFFERWGRDHAGAFSHHFAFDAARPWQRHRWRSAPDERWQEVHRTQDAEWAAFRLAVSLDQESALAATAMGFPRLLGGSHELVGYESAKAMLDAFASSERFQALACFDFIAGPTADSRRLQALRAGDLEAFVALHYGPDNTPRAAALLRGYCAAFVQHDPLA